MAMIKSLRRRLARRRERADWTVLALVWIRNANGTTHADLLRHMPISVSGWLAALHRLELAGRVVGQLEPWDDGPQPRRRRWYVTDAGRAEVIRRLGASS